MRFSYPWTTVAALDGTSFEVTSWLGNERVSNGRESSDCLTAQSQAVGQCESSPFTVQRLDTSFPFPPHERRVNNQTL